MISSRREVAGYLHQCFIYNRPTIGEIKKVITNYSKDPIEQRLAYHIALGIATRGVIRIKHPTHTTKLHPDVDAWWKAHKTKAMKMLATTQYDNMLPLDFFRFFVDSIGEPIPEVIIDYWKGQGLDLTVALTKKEQNQEGDDTNDIPLDIPPIQWVKDLVSQLEKEGKGTSRGTIEPNVLKAEIEVRYYKSQDKTPPDEWWENVLKVVPASN
jgi:hypothetical protein